MIVATHPKGTAAFNHAARQFSIFLALLFLALVVRAQTFGNPVLGFDEQFYLLVGDRMLHGAVPYVDIFDRKPVGLFLIYAAIRMLGGEGFIQYQLVASCFVAATAFLIYRAARALSDDRAAAIAACLYILWLCFVECAGGQAPVFFNLPVALAALLTLRAVASERANVMLGCAAMLLAGIAIQIKYTAAFEAFFFGLALLWMRHRSERRFVALIGVGVLWIGCALLPTALAALVYWHMGALTAFVFANFLSVLGRLPDPLGARLLGFVEIAGILAPLVLVVALGPRSSDRRQTFIWLWLGAALFGMLAAGSFLNPHYAAPVLVPLCIATAPFFASTNRRSLIGVTLLAFAFVASQAVTAIFAFQKGDRAEAMALANAARPRHGCIYVYDGWPALYMLTHSCLPTRWVFPGHLNTHDEAAIGALGVDPVVEERRILDTRPDVIVDESPVYALGNPQTHALVAAALARDYHLAAKIRTGTDRYRLVYRLNR